MNPDTSPSLSEHAFDPLVDIPKPEIDALLEPKARALWGSIRAMSAQEVLESACSLASFGEHDETWVYLTWLHARLGGRRHLKPKRLNRALFKLLKPKAFNTLEDDALGVVWALAQATPRARPTLDERSALGALALWIWSDAWALRAEALLREKPLPDSPDWLIRVVRALDTGHTSRTPVFALAKLQAQEAFWHTSALLCGVHLTHHYASWKGGPVGRHLEHACDVVAQSHPNKERHWVELMTDVTLRGRLDHPWLERIVSASIRLNLDNPARSATLRAYDEAKPYEASVERLRVLYAHYLDNLARDMGDPLTQTKGLDLHQEVLRLWPLNPQRAQYLLELYLLATTQTRTFKGGHQAQRDHMLGCVDEEAVAQRPMQELAALYVQTMNIDAAPARFVRQWHTHVQWSTLELVAEDDVQVYLIISDYDRAFAHLTCKYDGMTLGHGDKHAVDQLKYFIQKRRLRASAPRVLGRTRAPIDWIGSQIAGSGLLKRLTAQSVKIFEQRTMDQDLREQVLDALDAQGVQIERFEDIAALSLETIQGTLHQRRSRRILLGALIGGLSGALAPLKWGVLSIGDIPVLLGLSADICSRFCWYYGFDPKEHPELPMTILAVALGGSTQSALEPMLVRQNLQEFVLKKNLVFNPMARRALRQVAGRTLGQMMPAQMSAVFASTAQRMARRAVRRNLQERAVQATSSRALPMMSVILGATINGALIYDLCEAAQAVLTDRFLERKYPDWVSSFEEDLPEDVSLD